MTWALGQHPNIFPLEETHFLYKLAVDLNYLYEIGTAQQVHSFIGLAKYTPRQFRTHFGDACHRLIFEARSRIAKQCREAAIKDRARISTNVKFSRSWLHPKRRWADGTPENSHYVLPLLRLFPQARFIHILRNPRQVATSLMHFSTMGAHDYTEEDAYRTWTRLVRASALSEQALGPAKVLRIRHEDLLASPQDTLTRCLNFIGERYHPDCLMPLREKMNSSRYDDVGDCSIETNLGSTQPWISEAFTLYQRLLTGNGVVDGGAAPARRELKRMLNEYTDSLRPETNEYLARENMRLENECLSLQRQLKRLEKPLRMVDWGPQEIWAGDGFNMQEDGSSAIWVSTRHAPSDTTIYLGGKALSSAVDAEGNLVTAIVPAELTQQPAILDLVLRSASSEEATLPIPVHIQAPLDIPPHTSFNDLPAYIGNGAADPGMPD